MSPQNVDDPFEQILPTVHEAVRRSRLLVTFYNKLTAIPTGGPSLASEFGRLRDIVAPQIGNTQVLFPEFTPHDEPLHIAKLFQLADKFFGHVYGNLNAAELFLLASALYAHDWGMAVGVEEKEFLQAGAHASRVRTTFTPLPDEHARISAFMASEGIRRDPGTQMAMVPEDGLREYVRRTHARRSAARVRAHFQDHPAIGEAVAQLCEGHWLDFASLDDSQRFPREYEVAGQTTQLLALALQIRLIDLFHITDDRTPFALWRFVSPKDNRSSAEWKKHRALNAVSTVELELGRAIRVQGSTEDEEVWAGLQDLRGYCEDQVRRTLEISARGIPARYGLNFLKVEWKVHTGSLVPVDLKFTFDRAAMFRMLSEDIYDGNQYVFLRELLQNSIDAVKTRLARHSGRQSGNTTKKRSLPTFDTTIYFTAEHQTNGDITIKCRDYGIGMNEHVIKNYFAVAGVSYYRSKEFERQELGFEPISRFGVGILSCFMGTDGFEVKTYLDPECDPSPFQHDGHLPGADEHRARRLLLKVPAVDRQFIVKEITDDFLPGTEVKLHLRAAKLKSRHESPTDVIEKTVLHDEEHVNSAFSRALEITEYLCEIAGFVNYPIHVTETWPGGPNSPATLILHPDHDAEAAAAEFNGVVKVHQLSRAYPWAAVTEPECTASVGEQMTEHCFDLSELLGDKGYQGWVVFPKPRDENMDYSSLEFNAEENVNMQRNAVIWRERNTGNATGQKIGWNTPQNYADIKAFPRRTLFGVYRDGIRLDGITTASLPRAEQVFPLPMIHVNLPSSGCPRTNLARSVLNPAKTSWDHEIWPAIAKAVSPMVEDALRLEAFDGFYRLGWLGSVFRIAVQSMVEIVHVDRLPTPWLVPGKGIEMRGSPPKEGDDVPMVPRALGQLVRVLAHTRWLLRGTPEIGGFGWQGPASLVGASFLMLSVPLGIAWETTSYWATTHLLLSRIQFLKSPDLEAAPLAQNIYVVSTAAGRESLQQVSRVQGQRSQLLNEPSVVECLEIAVNRPGQLQPLQRRILSMVSPVPSENPALVPIPFVVPFEGCCTSGEGDLNCRHPVGVAVMRCLSAFATAEREGRLSENAKMRLVETISRSLYPMRAFVEHRGMRRDSRGCVAGLFKLALEHGVLAGFVAPELPPESEWAPGNRNSSQRIGDPSGNWEYVLASLVNPFGNCLR
jgi:hypothetical protein